MYGVLLYLSDNANESELECDVIYLYCNYLRPVSVPVIVTL